jgi:PAS domain S-box-containing protein
VCIRKNGERFPCEYSSVVSVDENGEECAITILVDISDRKKHEERILAALNDATVAREKYKNVLASTSDGYLTISSDWIYTYVNDKGANILHGKKPADIVGKHVFELFPDAKEHPIYLEFKKVMQSRVLSNMEGYYDPWNAFFQTRIFPAPDGGITIFFSDVTEQRTADLQLQKSRAEMQMILDNTDQLFMVLDKDLRLIVQNQAYQKRMRQLAGKDMENGQSVFSFVTAENSEEVKKIFTAVLAGEKIHRKFRTTDQKGETHVIDATFMPIAGIHGEVENIMIAARNITDEENARQALHNNELRFRSLIEKGGEIIALTDSTGTVIYISCSIKLILGYDAESRIGKRPFDLVHPDDIGIVKEKFAQLASEPNSCLRLQWRHKHANGSWRWMEGVATNLLDDPAVQAIVHNFRDVTIQKQNEDALRISNERYNLVSRATQDSIWDWNLLTNKVIRDGKRLETIFGYAPWEPGEVDHYWNKYAHPEDWQKVTESRNKLLANPAENYWQGEYRFLRADGEYAYVYDCGYILRDEQGRAIRIIGASHDITERKKYEEALKEKNNELKRLSAYLQRVREEERKYIAREVHDELGQLASALKIDIDWLDLRLTSVEEIARKRIDHANKTIEVLISSVRKIASSLRPSVLDDFGLNAALKWHCTEFQNLNGIQCMFESGFDDSGMNTHVKTELFRMAQESLTNVMRHAKASSVLVMTREDKENFYLSVTDNGQGFDGSEHKNTLGLVGLRERATSMNGYLEIESEPGKGTVISVLVPKDVKKAQ